MIEVLYMSNVVVLEEQMGEAGGEIQVANVRDLVVVKVKDREVPAHGDITLKPMKSKTKNQKYI